ncbi:unnamed protein product [Nesidiocoris tenuis]|uniref:Uncharacterized protein n=1 Tax=Nesidiocoris tenuis TaxID=355587 RepID=A0A6H5HAP7_9HEMI|nr:unnamed protein product [Nesidiocoris tenuis]
MPWNEENKFFRIKTTISPLIGKQGKTKFSKGKQGKPRSLKSIHFCGWKKYNKIRLKCKAAVEWGTTVSIAAPSTKFSEKLMNTGKKEVETPKALKTFIRIHRSVGHIVYPPTQKTRGSSIRLVNCYRRSEPFADLFLIVRQPSNPRHDRIGTTSVIYDGKRTNWNTHTFPPKVAAKRFLPFLPKLFPTRLIDFALIYQTLVSGVCCEHFPPRIHIFLEKFIGFENFSCCSRTKYSYQELRDYRRIGITGNCTLDEGAEKGVVKGVHLWTPFLYYWVRMLGEAKPVPLNLVLPLQTRSSSFGCHWKALTDLNFQNFMKYRRFRKS